MSNTETPNIVYKNKQRTSKLVQEFSLIQTDDYLSVLKNLGIPTSVDDSIEANLLPYSLIYNISLKKLRVFTGTEWKDAVEVFDILGENIEVVRDTNNNKIIISLKPTTVIPGEYNGLTIDDYGRITNANNDIFNATCKLTTHYLINQSEAISDW